MLTKLKLCLTLVLLGFPFLATYASPVPIRVTVFIHDDVPKNVRSSTFMRNVYPWTQEMQRITERDITVTYRERVPGITDIPYMDAQAIDNLAAMQKNLPDYLMTQNQANPDYRTEKFIVLTSRYAGTLQGYATPAAYTGFAFTHVDTTAAHELGHMFGADHDDGGTTDANGLWCQTFMPSVYDHELPTCNRYSDRNRQMIKRYLNASP